MSNPIPPYQPPVSQQDLEQYKKLAELLRNRKSKKRVELPNFI